VRRNRVQGLFDQLGDSAAACEERPERKGYRTKAGDKSSGGGSGKASDQGQRRVRDKGKAKVQDSWATGWLKKGEASRRKKEEKEEAYRKQKSQEERLKKEEEQRLLGQLERFIPEKGEERRERVRKIQEDAEADPEIRAELVEISRFLVEWESQQWDCEELDIPVEKAWPAHIANHPEAALKVNSKYRVEPDQHLPRAAHVCLVICKICDQHKPVVDRCTEWVEAQERAEAQIQAEQRHMVEFNEVPEGEDLAQWCPADGLTGPDCVTALNRGQEAEPVGTSGQESPQYQGAAEWLCAARRPGPEPAGMTVFSVVHQVKRRQ
jgi:hypothetical protein